MMLFCEMAWEIDLIRNISGSGGAFFNELFKIITMLGEEMLFIAIAAGLYWCYNKRYAYRFMFSYFGAALTVSALKNIVQRPRPFKNGIDSIGKETESFSFPSGHSQSAAAVFSQLAREFASKRRGKGHQSLYIYAGAAFLIMLTMYSRMYLAQHFLTDVLVGAAIGVLVPWGLNMVFDLMGKREELFSLLALVVFGIFIAVFRGEYSKLKDLYVATGAFCGVSIGYLIDKRFLRFEIKAKWWVYLVRFAVGIGIAYAIKEGLKAALPKENLWSDLFRYACMGLFASVGLFYLETLLKRVVRLVRRTDEVKESDSLDSAEEKNVEIAE